MKKLSLLNGLVFSSALFLGGSFAFFLWKLWPWVDLFFIHDQRLSVCGCETAGAFLKPSLGVWVIFFTITAFGIFASARMMLAAIAEIAATRNFVRRLRICSSFTYGKSKVSVFASSQPQSLTAGWMFPTIYASTALLDQLSRDELAVVLSHEQHHARHRDPLKRLFIHSLLAPLRPWKGSETLKSLMELTHERAADDEALKRHRRSTFFRAWAKCQNSISSVPSTIASFRSEEARLRLLLREPLKLHFPYSFAIFIVAMTMWSWANIGLARSGPLGVMSFTNKNPSNANAAMCINQWKAMKWGPMSLQEIQCPNVNQTLRPNRSSDDVDNSYEP